MKEVGTQLAADTPEAAQTAAQGADAGPVTGEQNGTASGAAPQEECGVRTGIYNTSVIQTHAPKLDGRKDS